MGCPSNGIRYNGSLCACPPGQLYNGTSKSCVLFGERSLISTDAGIDYYGVSFPETLFAYDSIKKFSQSQAVFLEATLVMLLSWLVCCFFLRFTKLGDGRTIWFRLRWWISRLDICYATRHWLDDQKVVMKRKTELGGTFSIASWMLFIGLFAALLYQIISKRTIEVHNNSNDGLINTTLLINYLSAYVVEIENRSIIGPVSFVADLGGLYCFSIGIFFYLLVQCEYRIKKLRTEDSILRAIKNRRKAQDRWDKLRKYVTYTWGCKTLHDDYNNAKDGSACCNLRVPSLHHNGSLRKSVSSQKGRQRSSLDSISFNKKVTSSSEKRATREGTHTLDEESVVAGATSNTEGRLSNSRGEPKQNPEMLGVANTGKKHFHHPDVGVAIKPQAFSHGDDYIIPPPPPLVLKDDSEIEMSDIQKNFQSLYDYNMTLRDKLVATQSSLRALAAMSTSPVSESQTQT
ncbi:uncharacterized protein LOC18039240 isoform X2 [Citrus clementina]|uniref:uncharacterized protein LOC18039240 isoform X2 n=1 Tax=Citrus clementina TaxID=85681 RepID=UPI0003D70105|nr:uncharacterized protein LOC18039240 isoform X2 [Citrus x clementina]